MSRPTRIYIIVEGQTEEVFVNELLVPHYATLDIYLTPIIVRTSPGHLGGVVRFGKIKPQIERLCKQDREACVTTLFDLYALPTDFPGRLNPGYARAETGQAKAEFLEAELARAINQPNFFAGIMVHEFEALLFVDIDAFKPWTDDDSALDALRHTRACTEPEDINDGALTAPSKRIVNAMPNYQKAFHGPLIACDIGLVAMRTNCPHFAHWLNKIEAQSKQA